VNIEGAGEVQLVIAKGTARGQVDSVARLEVKVVGRGERNRGAGLHKFCRHKNVVRILTNRSKKLLEGDEEGARS
jgi:hypothetical protein